jgi:hypothetical protein
MLLWLSRYCRSSKLDMNKPKARALRRESVPFRLENICGVLHIIHSSAEEMRLALRVNDHKQWHAGPGSE